MHDGSQGVLKAWWKRTNPREEKGGTGKFGESPCGISEIAKKRFWEKVKIGNPEECWPWLASVNRSGYGQFSLTLDTRRCRLAHRIAYWITNDSLDDEMSVLHSCDNPRCCNPKHLREGTQLDNIADMVARKRWNMRPATAANCKLTSEQVETIRSEYQSGG